MKNKRSHITQIHIAKKQLGLDDDTYRKVLKNATGKTSCADMDISELGKALQAMKDRGFKPMRKKANKKYGPKSRTIKTPAGDEIKAASPGDKIRALWIEMANDGIVQSSSEESLRKYIKRMSKGRYEAPQFCDSFTASRIIETLKQWRKRAELEASQCN